MIKYRKLKGYKYQLLEDYSIQTAIRPKDTIATGYAWDGFTASPDIDYAMDAALVHDCGYQLMREKHIGHACKDYIDWLFYSIMLERGVPYWKAKIYYFVVKHFGAYALKPKEI